MPVTCQCAVHHFFGGHRICCMGNVGTNVPNMDPMGRWESGVFSFHSMGSLG